MSTSNGSDRLSTPVLAESVYTSNEAQVAGSNEAPQPTATTGGEPKRNLIRKLADAYFEPKAFETEAMYRRLGVGLFKRYLPTSGDLVMRYVWRASMLPRGKSHEATLENFQTWTRAYEALHLGMFVLSTALLTGIGGYETPRGAVISTVGNTVVNVYPLMLQRYNRIRANRALSRIRRKAAPL